jgi:C-terminal processing protease CtpA/Prc
MRKINPHNFSLYFLVFLLLVLLYSCATRNESYLEDFELVWQTIDETFYDPEFGGIDWDDIHEKYENQFKSVGSDIQFFNLINQMLFELNVSHAIVVLPGGWINILPTAIADGSIGIDIRLLNGEAVIVSVQPGSTGEDAGLRPGYIIQSINGKSINQIIDEGVLPDLSLGDAPPRNDRFPQTLSVW